MLKRTRWILLISLITVAMITAWNFTPNTSSQSREKKEAASSSRQEQLRQTDKRDLDREQKREQTGKKTELQSLQVGEGEDESEEADDPDLPPGMAGRVDKAAYLRARADYINLLR